MRMPVKIKVRVEEDRMGNIIAEPVNQRFAKAFAKVRKSNGGGGDTSAFFNAGGEAEEFMRSNLSAKQRRDIESGWPIVVKVDPWIVGHWYGYDAHTVAEENTSLRQRGYLNEAKGKKLTKKQEAEVIREMVKVGVPVRFMIGGQVLNILTGELQPKGGNVMHNWVFWNFTKETSKKIAKWLGAKPVFSK